jgi:hypothetical protein
MRRVARALLRAGAALPALPAAPASAVPRALAGWHAGEPAWARGGRASSSAAPTGWAASVLEHTASSLHAGEEEEEDDDELGEADGSNAFRRRRAAQPPLDDDDDDLEDDDDELLPRAQTPARAASGNSLVWPPPPEALRDNPALAELARAARARHLAAHATAR